MTDQSEDKILFSKIPAHQPFTMSDIFDHSISTALLQPFSGVGTYKKGVLCAAKKILSVVHNTPLYKVLEKEKGHNFQSTLYATKHVWH